MSDVKEPRTVVKKEDFATLFSDGTILVKMLRASYPHVLSRYKGDDDDGEGKHSIVGLMPKQKPYFRSKDLIKGEIDRIISEAKLKGLPPDRKFLRDGDQAGKEECEGMFTINASESRRPTALHRIRDPKTKKPKVLEPGKDDDVIYPGCWVNILIRPWYQDHKKYGKRVNAGLVAVQFVKDDEAFGQSRISQDEIASNFDEFADDDASGYDDSLGDENYEEL